MTKRIWLVALLPLVACSREDKIATDAVGTTNLTSAAQDLRGDDVFRGSFIDDSPALTRRVEAKIAEDSALSLAARNVSVSVDRGIATLSGSVPDYPTRDRVEVAVRSVPGVARMYDDVQVAPLEDVDSRESDENIAFSLQRAFASDSRVAPEADQLTIDVDHGRVTLRGTIPSAETRAAIDDIIGDTPGVMLVVNRLRTAPTSQAR